MSWKMWATALSFAAVAGAAGPVAQASDRRDGPATTGSPATDIVDLYAWMDASGKNVNFVLTVNPSATNISVFDPNALYVIHTSARSGLADTSPAADVPIICQIKSTARSECWVGRVAYAKGGLDRINTSADQKLSYFAGRRNDPYFGYDNNTNGLGGMMTSMKTTLTGKTRNANGCYAFVAAETTSAKNALTGGTVVDNFRGLNVLAIAITVDKALLLAQGKTSLAVWATTNRPM
jgi:hypothetical protein